MGVMKHRSLVEDVVVVNQRLLVVVVVSSCQKEDIVGVDGCESVWVYFWCG